MDESNSHSTSAATPPAPIDRGLLFFALSLIVAFVFFSVTPSMADADLWWHLRDTQIQLTSHSFLTHDLYSFTAANSPWMNHEWLAELPLYAGFHVLGYTGVYLVTLLTIEIIFIGLFYFIYLESVALFPALVGTLFAILLSTVSFGPRTLLFGWLLLVVELLIIVASRRNQRAIWALPVLFLIWVNTHGSWLIGMVIFAMFIASKLFTINSGAIANEAASPQQIKHLILAWCASLAALFINPYGWRLVFYPFDLAFHQKLNIANIEEWKTLDFHSPRGRILFACLGLMFLLQLLYKRKWTLFELAVTALGLYSAFNYSRFLFLAAILVGPVFARSLASRYAEKRKPFSPLIAMAGSFLILCCIIGRARNIDLSSSTKNNQFPFQALPFLDTFHPTGNLFNEYTWGGFLIWHQRDIPVFVDSRVDIFEYNGTFKDYLDISHLNDSMAILDRHQIKYVLYGRNTPLIYLLKTSHQWKVDYEDPNTTLLERIAPTPASPTAP